MFFHVLHCCTSTQKNNKKTKKTPLITLKLPYMIKFHETRVITHFDYFATLGMYRILRIFRDLFWKNNWKQFYQLKTTWLMKFSDAVRSGFRISNFYWKKSFGNPKSDIPFCQVTKTDIFGKVGILRKISISTYQKPKQVWWQSTIKKFHRVKNLHDLFLQNLFLANLSPICRSKFPKLVQLPYCHLYVTM